MAVADWYLGCTFKNEDERWWTHDLLDMHDTLCRYLGPQPPFQSAYSYSQLMKDLREFVAESPYNDLWEDFWDIFGPIEEISRSRKEINKQRRTKDPWSGYKKLTASQRGELARDRVPFKILGIRRNHGKYRQSKEWEREQQSVWQLLIHLKLGHGNFILTLARNRGRDAQLTGLLGNANLAELSFQLEWKDLANGHRVLALQRERLKL